jgi:hypothetical protein
MFPLVKLNQVNESRVTLTGHAFWGLIGGLSSLAFMVPRATGFLYGDDFLLYEASKSPGGYASNFLTSFQQIGGGKYRPLFTPIASVLLNIFGRDYFYFQLVVLAVLSCTAFVGACIAYKLSNNWTVSAVVAAVIPMSRFTWYAQTTLHGVMEILAVFWMFLGLLALVTWLHSNYQSRKYLVLAVLGLGASAFTHERYLIICITLPIAVMILCKGRLLLRSQIFALWAVVGLQFILKKYVVHVDIFQGGGETPLRSSAGAWIAQHFGLALLGVFGFSSGATDYYQNLGHGLFPTIGWSRLARLAGVVSAYLALVLAILRKQLHVSAIDRSLRNERVRVLLVLVTCAFSLLIPASTVISRTEGRWLLGSDLILLIVLVLMGNLIATAKIRSFALAGILAGAVLMSVVTRHEFQRFSYDRRQAQLVLQLAQDASKPGNSWNLDINVEGMIEWQFAYGRAFSQLTIPPTGFTFGGQCDSPCLHIEGSGFLITPRWS